MWPVLGWSFFCKIHLTSVYFFPKFLCYWLLKAFFSLCHLQKNSLDNIQFHSPRFKIKFTSLSLSFSSILDWKKSKDHLPVKVGLKSRPLYFERRKRWAISQHDWLHQDYTYLTLVKFEIQLLISSISTKLLTKT